MDRKLQAGPEGRLWGRRERARGGDTGRERETQMGGKTKDRWGDRVQEREEMETARLTESYVVQVHTSRAISKFSSLGLKLTFFFLMSCKGCRSLPVSSSLSLSTCCWEMKGNKANRPFTKCCEFYSGEGSLQLMARGLTLCSGFLIIIIYLQVFSRTVRMLQLNASFQMHCIENGDLNVCCIEMHLQ